MPDGFKLGSAFIEVNPDADDFKPKLKEALDKDKTEIKVSVSPDTTGFKDKVKAGLEKDRTDLKVPVTADTERFKADVDKAVLEESRKRVKISLDYDKSQLNSLMRDAGGDGGSIFTKAFNDSVGGAGGGGGGISGGGAALGVGIGAAIVAALAVLPATMASIGALAGVGLGTALVLELDKNNKKLEGSLNGMLSTVKNVLQQAVEPMVVPLEKAFGQISGWVRTLKPELTSLFSDSAKFVMPLVKGMESFVNELLPGFNKLMAAAGPTVKVFADSLGRLGGYFADVFRDLIPGLAGSDKAFLGFIDLMGILLDTIAKVASSLASGSGKVLGQFFVSLGNFIEGTLMGLMPAVNAILNTLLPPLMHLAQLVVPLIAALGNGLAPVIKMFAPLLMAMVKALDPMVPIFVQMISIVSKAVVEAFSPLLKALVPLLPLISKIIAEMGDGLLGVLRELSPLFAQFGGLVGQLAKVLLPPLFEMITKLIPPLIKVQMAFLQALMPAIQQMIPVLVKLIDNLQPLINFLMKVIPIIVEFAARIEVDVIRDALAPFIGWVAKVVSSIVDVIAYFVKWAGNLNDWKNLWKQVFTDVQNWWDAFERYIVQHLDDIKSDITNWLNDVRRTMATGWNNIYHDIDSIWGHIANDFHDWWSNLINFFTGEGQKIRNTLSNAWNDVFNDVKHVWGNIESFFDGFWRHIEGGASAAISAFSKAWSGIENAFKSPVNFLINTVYDNGIRRFWNDIVNAVGLKSLDLPNVAQLSHGGIIPGYQPGIDSRPAILSKGEAVLVPDAVNYLGHDTIHALNKRFAPSGATTAVHNGVLHAAGGFNPISSIEHAVTGVVDKAKDVASILAAVATGNTTAMVNDLTKMVGTTAAGPLGEVMTAIPKTLISNMLKQFTAQQASAPGGGSVSGPAGGATGSEMANGLELYKYLLTNLFGGAKVAAAGATASIWGESTWNPFAQGTGGRGLIGWTPPGTISDAAFKGGMSTQLPAIIEFVVRNGDMGVVDRMKSMSDITQAAYAWGQGVERYGIPDVHPQGLALASRFMGGYANGTKSATPGWAWVGERGPELVRMMGGETVLNHATSNRVGNIYRGYATGTQDASEVSFYEANRQQALADADYYQKLSEKQNISASRKSGYLQRVSRYKAQAARDATEAAKYRTAESTLLTSEQKSGNSIIAALAATYSGGGLPSASQITSDLSSALKAVTNYYSGGKAKNLEIQLEDQANTMKLTLAKFTSLTATITAGKAYATSVTSNLSSYADLSNLGAVPTSGSGAGFGSAVQFALSQKLSSLRTFNSLLKSAVTKKISSSFLQQAIALGPDGGTQYLQAIMAGGSGLISTINTMETQLTATETAIGQNAANIVYDPASIGKGFLAGLNSQSAALNKTMQSLGAEFSSTVARDLRIPVKDLPHFASGGIAQAGTLAMVGENGPELVRFNQQATVYNAQQTAQMGSSEPVVINFYGPQYPTPEQIANLKLEFAKQMGPYNL